MGTLQAQNKALREAYAALFATTSQSLSAFANLRQSATRLAAEVRDAERDRASHRASATPTTIRAYYPDVQMANALRAVEEQGRAAGAVEGRLLGQMARVEELLVREGLGGVVEEGKRRGGR
ncbi:hypothetical protein AJ79_08974 [Helicocarpus griseus UAMH5409]|uniref:Uncharacterized protein n=1 Tax=Helicocarpus griseus UAMH5409 TaxID=1447875 RepID=A0A2B7WNS3_9EURO|nr:hypothetical protein AJ79_08974 [Helicocarpus griseus UAMH5409]